MLNTLFGRISLAVLIIFITLSALLVSAIDDSARALETEAVQKLHMDLAANIVKDKPLWLEEGKDASAIEDAFSAMMMVGPILELYIVAPDGELLNYSDPDGKVVRKRIDMAPVAYFLKDRSMLPILGDDPRSPVARKIFSVAPIYHPDVTATDPGSASPVAYMYIIIGGQQYDSVMSMLRTSRFGRLGLSTIAVGAVFLILVMLLLFFLLTRPIRRLSSGLAEFRGHQYMQLPASLPPGQAGGRDELNQLTLTINDMADRIVSQFNEMIHNRNLRQELITHISHDLRTPLTSIRGYLESWQISQGHQSDDQARRCVEIALRNCDQLEQMVEELFEFSRLESNEIKPEFESFPLRELVEDIIQKFDIKAQHKNLQLICNCPDNQPNIRADIGHINRVFSNLLDNAIRHSKPGEKIVISLQVESDDTGIVVKIEDTGSGIPEAEIPFLFEPYFRASNGDRHYTKGTGLGLAITRRLLALQNADITVESREGAGTVFSFTLLTARDRDRE